MKTTTVIQAITPLSLAATVAVDMSLQDWQKQGFPLE